MQALNPSVVTAWKDKVPAALAVRCGFCGSNEFFRFDEWKQHGPMRYAYALCPNCHNGMSFAIANFADSSKQLGGGTLCMYPAKALWTVANNLDDALKQNPELHRDYWLGVNSFNNKEPIGVVLAARRALEGLANQFVPADKRASNLAINLRAVNQHHDLSDVIYKMSEAIKDAGNLGAHFGAGRLTDQIAFECLSMASDFLVLHYVLEGRVAQLKTLVAQAQAMPIQTEIAEQAGDPQPAPAAILAATPSA